MSNNWNYKIELKTLDVFEEINKKFGFSFPSDLRDFIIENNAASPEKNCIAINDIERIYSETLSFNVIETEATSFFALNFVFDIKKYIPFALDPFGNFFCYSLENGFICFYDHEENTMESTEMDLESFIKSMH